MTAIIDTLGDRMKMFEEIEAGRKFMPLLPVVARIDGRTFHTFTRGLERPFDATFSKIMEDVMVFLTKETNALMGYTQSDEITLVWDSQDTKSQIFFDGRISKMNSQLAALASIMFFKLVSERLPKEYADKLPTFDSRVWQVPNQTEAANVFLWREWDATKNSVSMAARAHFSAKALFGKKRQEMMDMLFEKGINWNDYPIHFKRGVYAQKRSVTRNFTPEELVKLPDKHAAKINPELKVVRSEWKKVDMPIFGSIMNREGVIFNKEFPVIKS